MPSHREPWRSQTCMRVSVETHVSQVVRRVVPVFVNTTYRQRIAAHTPPGIGNDRQSVAKFRPPKILDIKDFYKFLHEFLCSGSFFQISAIKRIHVLVKAAKADG